VHLSAFDLLAFNLLAFNGRDLRAQPLMKRQAALQGLLERFGCPAISLSEPFGYGPLLSHAQPRQAILAATVTQSGCGADAPRSVQLPDLVSYCADGITLAANTQCAQTVQARTTTQTKLRAFPGWLLFYMHPELLHRDLADQKSELSQSSARFSERYRAVVQAQRSVAQVKEAGVSARPCNHTSIDQQMR
jgi:hypothetical protein